MILFLRYLGASVTMTVFLYLPFPALTSTPTVYTHSGRWPSRGETRRRRTLAPNWM